MSKLVLENVKDFNPTHIFESGQCFRWAKEEDGSYTGVAYGKILNVSKLGRDIVLENTNVDDFEDIWRDYFDFDTDYDLIKKDLSYLNNEMGKAIAYGNGIRILNQELWETMISFIISANNNIPRIKGCIEKICELFGDEIGEYRGKTYYSFPSAKVMSELTSDDLIPCSLGYRSKYILQTAKQFVNEDKELFDYFLNEDTESEDVFRHISTFAGVGPKVANCILLFALKKRDRFPIDVWVKKVMVELYGFKEDDTTGMEMYAKENFGNKAGIAQQYLFYYMRNKNDAEEFIPETETKIIAKRFISEDNKEGLGNSGGRDSKFASEDKSYKDADKKMFDDDKEDYRETFRREDSRRIAREELKNKAIKARVIKTTKKED